MFGVRRNLRSKESDGSVKKGFFQIHAMDSKTKISSGADCIFVNPSTHMIVMHGCYLHNSSSRAEKIHKGEIHKERCAWITCERYEILPLSQVDGDEIRYNPKDNPFFELNGTNVDKSTFTMLITNGTRIILK